MYPFQGTPSGIDTWVKSMILTFMTYSTYVHIGFTVIGLHIDLSLDLMVIFHLKSMFIMFMWLAREVLQNLRAGNTYKLIELLFSLCICHCDYKFTRIQLSRLSVEWFISFMQWFVMRLSELTWQADVTSRRVELTWRADVTSRRDELTWRADVTR